jgi:phosphatidylinositol alpha 1,6-mannosyltransferase
MPRAVFLGQHGGEQLARIFASLDVFVHSGCHETFGQTIQEAAASGLPVVVPAVGGPVDLVDDGVTGYLVPPGDASALASAVVRMADDPAARATLGQAGRQRVAAGSWAALGDVLLGHYAAVLARDQELGRHRDPGPVAGGVPGPGAAVGGAVPGAVGNAVPGAVSSAVRGEAA